jgi:hypothetical protein
MAVLDNFFNIYLGLLRGFPDLPGRKKSDKAEAAS